MLIKLIISFYWMFQITQLNKNFDVLNIIQSDKVDISSFEWKINKPIILNNNQEYILR